MFEIVIDNRDGNLWDITQLVTSVSWKTSRIGKPASLDISLTDDPYQRNKAFKMENGNVIRFRSGDHNLFYGYIFLIDHNHENEMNVNAFDQTRYLAASASYFFTNATATSIIRRIAEDMQMKTGEFADTVYPIPKVAEQGQRMSDIIVKVLWGTTYASGKTFNFYDDFGLLTLKRLEDMKLRLVLGDNSLVTGYQLSNSIDSDTYNYIILAQDNKKKGTIETYGKKDEATIAKWGRLQLYQKVDEKLNAAQINKQLDDLLELENREKKTFKLDALGDYRVRAGCGVRVQIEALQLDIDVVVNDCTHKFDGGSHTMSLDLAVI